MLSALQSWLSPDMVKHNPRRRILLNYALTGLLVLALLWTLFRPQQPTRAGALFIPGQDEHSPGKLPGFAPGADSNPEWPTEVEIEEAAKTTEADSEESIGPQYSLQEDSDTIPEGGTRPESERPAAPVVDDTEQQQAGDGGEGSPAGEYSATIVIGRMKKEAQNVQWAFHDLENVNPVIYLVDDPKSALHLEKNHGRESRVYLQYILDNYDALSDVTFFWHPDRKIWHNNFLLGWDSVKMVNSFNRSYVMTRGYAPARCDHWPGCPKWATFTPTEFEHRADPHVLSDMFNDKLLHRLFPNSTVFPPYFAGTCCSQFAVSRDAIRRNPKELYQRIANWIDEYLYDQLSGRVMEMLWQYIFLGKGTYCPAMHDCYCRTYGVCLDEESQDIQELKLWDDFRLRFHELTAQKRYMEKEWDRAKKESEKAGKKPDGSVRDHPEYKRIGVDWQRNKKLYNIFRDHLIGRWKLGEPPNTW